MTVAIENNDYHNILTVKWPVSDIENGDTNFALVMETASFFSVTIQHSDLKNYLITTNIIISSTLPIILLKIYDLDVTMIFFIP